MGCGTLIFGIIGLAILNRMDAPWWAFAILIGVMVFMPSKPPTVEVPDPPWSPEEIDPMKEARDRVNQAREDIRKRRDDAARERVERTAPLVAPQATVPIGTIKMMRNALLEHHNARQTDPEYLKSHLAIKTNGLVTVLNNWLEEQK